MRFERPFPVPERWPSAPHSLAKRLAAYLDRTLRIEIFVQAGERWERFNVLHMDDEPTTPDTVGSLVKACADAHARELGRGGKYRAILVRRVGEIEHRTATFKVAVPGEEPEPAGHRGPVSGDPWAVLTDAALRYAELVVRSSDQSVDRLVQRQGSADSNSVRAMLHDLEVIYREGLRMRGDAAREDIEQRAQEQIARVRAQADARTWALLEPVIAIVTAQFREAFERRPSARTRAARGRTRAPRC